jgi:hypothetical protein
MNSAQLARTVIFVTDERGGYDLTEAPYCTIPFAATGALWVTIVHHTTGEVLRALILDPNKDYQPQNKKSSEP